MEMAPATANEDDTKSSSATSSATPTTVTIPAATSDRMVWLTMQKGFENIVLQSGAGLILGGLVGIVLARGGSTVGARKIYAGLGAGIGLGSSWTRASMDLEDLLAASSSRKK